MPAGLNTFARVPPQSSWVVSGVSVNDCHTSVSSPQVPQRYR
jgi:hypothetical protein